MRLSTDKGSDNFDPGNGPGETPKAASALPPQGVPVPPPMQGYQPKPSSALAITALVLTILGLLTAIFMVGGLLGLVGLILAIVALAKIKKGNASGKGMAITSTILGTLSIILAVGVLIFNIMVFVQMQECAKKAQHNSNGEYTCEVMGMKFTGYSKTTTTYRR